MSMYAPHSHSKRRTDRRLAGTLFLSVLLLIGMVVLPRRGLGQTSAGTVDWTAIGAALGFHGTLRQSGVFKIAFTRQMSVTLQGTPVQPALVADGFLTFFMPKA